MQVCEREGSVRWEEKKEEREERVCLINWTLECSSTSRLVKMAGRGSERLARLMLLWMLTRVCAAATSQSSRRGTSSLLLWNPCEKNSAIHSNACR